MTTESCACCPWSVSTRARRWRPGPGYRSPRTTSLTGSTVCRSLIWKPAVIQVDNGTEFASRALDASAYREDVRLDFSRPGKPTDNAHIESFNAWLRAACLNAHVFESLEDAEETLTSWRSDYSAVRLHSALGMLTPREFAELGQRNPGRRRPKFLAVRVASNRGEDHVRNNSQPV
jgi:transposase InsO family protein